MWGCYVLPSPPVNDFVCRGINIISSHSWRFQGDYVSVSQHKRKVFFNDFVLFLVMYLQRPVSTGLGEELGLAITELNMKISVHVPKIYKWSLGKEKQSWIWTNAQWFNLRYSTKYFCAVWQPDQTSFILDKFIKCIYNIYPIYKLYVVVQILFKKGHFTFIKF